MRLQYKCFPLAIASFVQPASLNHNVSFTGGCSPRNKRQNGPSSFIKTISNASLVEPTNKLYKLSKTLQAESCGFQAEALFQQSTSWCRVLLKVPWKDVNSQVLVCILIGVELSPLYLVLSLLVRLIYSPYSQQNSHRSQWLAACSSVLSANMFVLEDYSESIKKKELDQTPTDSFGFYPRLANSIMIDSSTV